MTDIHFEISILSPCDMYNLREQYIFNVTVYLSIAYNATAVKGLLLHVSLSEGIGELCKQSLSSVLSRLAGQPHSRGFKIDIFVSVYAFTVKRLFYH